MAPATARTKLTKRVVDGLGPADEDRVVFDSELPGFGLKITPSGHKVFLSNTVILLSGLGGSGAT